jgi:hypothetical protein
VCSQETLIYETCDTNEYENYPQDFANGLSHKSSNSFVRVKERGGAPPGNAGVANFGVKLEGFLFERLYIKRTP